jgi:hypothetical protein
VESSSQPLDALELARALNRHGVDCVVIGGVAMQVHGHVRTTRDLDTIAAWTPENMRALAGALAELEARLRGVDAELLGIDLTDPRQLYEGGNFLMHTRHGDLDVFGADQTVASPPYERLRARALEVEIRGVMLRIAHPEDLIRMKTAASRFRDRLPEKRRQDLEDIVVLERIAAERDAAAAARLLDPTRGQTATPEATSERDPGARPRPARGPRQPPQDRRRRSR